MLHVMRREDRKRLDIASPQELRRDSRGDHGTCLRKLQESYGFAKPQLR